MISFACQNINLKDIITCSFELSKTEYDLLLFLLQEDESLTISVIATKKSLERSTIQKAMSKLYTKKLVERRQLNLQSGGYRFMYAVLDKEEVKVRLLKIIHGWHANVINAVNKW